MYPKKEMMFLIAEAIRGRADLTKPENAPLKNFIDIVDRMKRIEEILHNPDKNLQMDEMTIELGYLMCQTTGKDYNQILSRIKEKWPEIKIPNYEKDTFNGFNVTVVDFSDGSKSVQFDKSGRNEDTKESDGPRKRPNRSHIN